MSESSASRWGTITYPLAGNAQLSAVYQHIRQRSVPPGWHPQAHHPGPQGKAQLSFLPAGARGCGCGVKACGGPTSHAKDHCPPLPSARPRGGEGALLWCEEPAEEGGACTLTSVLAKSKFYLVRKEEGQSQTLELLSSWRRHNRTTTTRPHALLGEPAPGEGPTRGELARWPCAGVTEACCSDVRPLGRGKKGVATRFCPFWAIKWSFED